MRTKQSTSDTWSAWQLLTDSTFDGGKVVDAISSTESEYNAGKTATFRAKDAAGNVLATSSDWLITKKDKLSVQITLLGTVDSTGTAATKEIIITEGCSESGSANYNTCPSTDSSAGLALGAIIAIAAAGGVLVMCAVA